MRSRIQALLTAGMLVAPGAMMAQGGAADASHKVAGGGITIAGWLGQVDPRDSASGSTVKDAKFAAEGSGFHITTGPATTFWNPANKASGNYTVKATFMEPKFMGLNDHPHPYGIVIAANSMGTPQQSLLYCEAYGTGTFIVRGFGPTAFALGGRRPTANDAVHKAGAPGQPVTQEIAMTVKDGAVSCSINGTVVATFPKDSVVAPGRLKSTDGMYGVRMAHNTEAVVTGFSMSKQ
jgi:hypothetical protein